MNLKEIVRPAFVAPRLKGQKKATRVEYYPSKGEEHQALRREIKSSNVFVKFFTDKYKKILNWHIESKQANKEVKEYYAENRRRKEAALKYLTDTKNVGDNIFHEKIILSLRKEIDEITPYSEKIFKKVSNFYQKLAPYFK